ncbi:MAG: hypothetical protein RMY35_003735 [Nostoc sp. DedSLP01]
MEIIAIILSVKYLESDAYSGLRQAPVIYFESEVIITAILDLKLSNLDN